MRHSTDFSASVRILWPMRLDPLWHQEVGRNRLPSALSHFSHTFRERRHCGAHNQRMRPLVRLHDVALADLWNHGLSNSDFEKLTFQVVRRLRLPNLQHHVDAFYKHGISVSTKVTKDLCIRHQATRADAHDESAFEHMVHHGSLRCNSGRVRIRHIDRACAEHDVFGFRNQASQKNHR